MKTKMKGQEEMKRAKRIATLTQDATLYENSIQLHYKRRGYSSLFSGPPASICPPVELLKKGTKIRLTFDDRYVQLLKIELVKK